MGGRTPLFFLLKPCKRRHCPTRTFPNLSCEHRVSKGGVPPNASLACVLFPKQSTVGVLTSFMFLVACLPAASKVRCSKTSFMDCGHSEDCCRVPGLLVSLCLPLSPFMCVALPGCCAPFVSLRLPLSPIVSTVSSTRLRLFGGFGDVNLFGTDLFPLDFSQKPLFLLPLYFHRKTSVSSVF